MSTNQPKQTVLSVLIEARKILTPREKWTKRGWVAYNARGRECEATDPKAVTFCLCGAIARAAGSMESRLVTQCHEALLGRKISFAQFNDAPERKHKDVLGLLDKTIKAKRALTAAHGGEK